MTPPNTRAFSPTTRAPETPLEELAQADPAAFAKYINSAVDTPDDYKSSKYAKEHPSRSGLRHLEDA